MDNNPWLHGRLDPLAFTKLFEHRAIQASACLPVNVLETSHMHLRQACVLQVAALTFVLAAALFRLQHAQQPLFKRHLAVRWFFPLRLEGGKEFRDLELLAVCGDFLSAFGKHRHLFSPVV